MSLILLAVGTVLVSIALFNKLPRYVPGRLPAPGAGRAARQGALATAHRTGAVPRVRLESARLTEQGKALLATLGGSALIVAFFLTLSGL
ncbi:hypothetical protein Q8791_01630 [Nocardiopsis sp. CT-R113]|uniref:Uncharacterized protein n=1 Tax=Nocardiopsis codii TaxID=3065942 RepID=A0ABU7K306_9ACTN|nr:hypothetical protein [Nocardiopsis sp. CT-R113]MEE2035922.1 hypothetical protein [Nocardiopsis sp. CT-R113]